MLRKDLRLELRSGESTLALLALSMLVLVVLVFALDAARVRSVDAAAGALWVAMVFAGMLGANRALLAERDNGAIRGLLLSPLDPGTLYAAKLAAALIFMAVAEVGAVILMVLFFNLEFDASIARLAPILALGAIGFSALATLLSAITGRTRGGDMLLPILAVPIFVPALIAGVKASAAALAGAPLDSMTDWLKIMIAFDVLFVTAGYLLFEHVVGAGLDYSMNSAIRNWLGYTTLALMIVALFMVFDYVPPEAEQGIAQLIFYFHVPLAWVAFASFGIVAIAGIFYLWLGDQLWDDLGYAAAETGMVFCTLMIVAGSIWAKPIWGTWWTWDSRLTTTFILWLMYGGYLMLRASADDTPQVARFGAVLGIVAALDVPIVIASVRLWRTIHPAVLVTKQGGHGLEDPRMVATLLVCLAAFTALWAWLLMLRFQQLRTRTRMSALAMRIAFANAAASDKQVMESS